MNYETQYLKHMKALIRADEKKDRTGTGTRSIFGHQIKHDMRYGFPLLTTKKVFLKGIIHELLWFLKGDTNIKYLTENNVHIWNEWATEEGELGPIYGKQWRNFEGVDQIEMMASVLRTDPCSRRNIVSAWNPKVLPLSCFSPKENAELDRQALPPCHTLFQVNCAEIPFEERIEYWRETVGASSVSFNEAKELEVSMFMDTRNVPKYYIDLQLYQRSADWFLGVPFNAASYSLLLMMLAQVSNMIPRYFVHTFGDTHLYSNHIEQAKEQLSRTAFVPPKMSIHNRDQSIYSFSFDDFELRDYQCHPAIKAEVSI